MKYEDVDIDPEVAEERERASREAELARRIRREVLRVQRGEADDEIREDEDLERSQREELQEREARVQRRKASIGGQLLSGKILVPKEGTGYYRYVMFIAVMFFISIVVMFTTLRLDIRHSRLQDQVQILKERATRLQEERFHRTTHSAIVNELDRRGIDLHDPVTPAETLKK